MLSASGAPGLFDRRALTGCFKASASKAAGMLKTKNPAPGATGDGAGFGTRVSAECGSNSFNNQETCVATPEQAWERLRRAILDQQTKPSTENALRIRRWSDALVGA